MGPHLPRAVPLGEAQQQGHSAPIRAPWLEHSEPRWDRLQSLRSLLEVQEKSSALDDNLWIDNLKGSQNTSGNDDGDTPISQEWPALKKA